MTSYYQSKLNKTFSFTGFPWHLDENDEWLNMKSNNWHRRSVDPGHRSSIQLGILLGNKRSRSEMKHAEIDLRTRKYPYYQCVTSRDPQMLGDPTREEKVNSWLDKSLFSSRDAKYDIKNAWSDKI